MSATCFKLQFNLIFFPNHVQPFFFFQKLLLNQKPVNDAPNRFAV